MNEAIRFEVKGAVAVITIDRPERRNAINNAVREGLFQAWQRLEESPALRVGVLTGAGDKAFCAGMDLKEAAELGLGVPPRGFFPVLGDNVNLSKPVIAAVNGAAYAGGWLFAQMCDLCIAADHAEFAITEAKVGRGMPWLAPLVKMLPQRIVMELLLTAAPMSAARAHELGYVNRVVPAKDLMGAALAMADQIAANAPLSVQAARELVYLSGEMGRAAGLRVGDHVFDRVYRSDDALEGPRAFVEKRPPRWTGR